MKPDNQKIGTFAGRLLFIPFAFMMVLPFMNQCARRKQILVDGSSTVYPITEAVAEEFKKKNQKTQVTVGVSGTGGGFKKFCIGETDISDASRRIKGKEIKKCNEHGIRYLELSVAYDGLAVLVNKENTWVEKLTKAQLRKIFGANEYAKTWKDVNPSWPAERIKVFAPGHDSGTHDYFVSAILGKKKVPGKKKKVKRKMRGAASGASFSEDDNVLVRGIAGNKGAIGFFGLAYYEENKDKLKLVPIVNPGTGQAVQPTQSTVKTGSYAPLSRPIFIYISQKSSSRPEVREFVNFYLQKAGNLSREVGYIPLADSIYKKNIENYQKFK